MSAISLISSLLMIVPGQGEGPITQEPRGEETASVAFIASDSSQENWLFSAAKQSDLPAVSHINCYAFRNHMQNPAFELPSHGALLEPTPKKPAKINKVLLFSFSTEDIERTLGYGDTYVAQTQSIKISPYRAQGQTSIVIYVEEEVVELALPLEPAKQTTRLGGVYTERFQVSCLYEPLAAKPARN